MDTEGARWHLLAAEYAVTWSNTECIEGEKGEGDDGGEAGMESVKKTL